MDFSLHDDRPKGNSHLYYSKPGVGKTASLITLAEAVGKPVKVYYAENREPKQPMMASYPDLCRKVEIDFTRHDSFDGYINDANQLKLLFEQGKAPYGALAFDSLTFVQQLFKLDMEDDRFDDRLGENKRANRLTDRFRVEQSDWGGLGSMMKRLTRILQMISVEHGIPIVCFATLAEYPSYNKAMEAAPAFQGKDYGDSFTGFFDFIGLVQESDKADKPYPPHVFFKSHHDDFIAKSVSRNINEMLAKRGYIPLDFRIILDLIARDSV